MTAARTDMPARTSSPSPAGAPASSAPFPVQGRHCHLIGIGGCGMSSLARLLMGRGAIVTGSDTAPSTTTETLARHGVPITFDQSAGLLPERTQLVIASAAVKPDNPELSAAVISGMRVLTYPEALGLMMLGRTSVAIAGTHGKSTTTAMLGHALIQAGLDPSVIVGATSAHLVEPGQPPAGFRVGSDTIPTGALAGQPGVLVAEACEFNRSFHHLHPTVATIMSVEADHLDVYGSLDAIVRAFADFAARLPSAADGGRLLIAHEGAHRAVVAADTRASVETIGFDPSADWVVSYDNQTNRVELAHAGALVASWINTLPGAHMAMNAAVAATLAIWMGACPRRVEQALGGFTGLDRRMQLLGERRMPHWPEDTPAVRVYDDYGHHPTEIEATLRALRQSERPEARGGRLVCVFQPHQHSRTRYLLEEFARSFSQADLVIVPQIYFVRDPEHERAKISAGDLVDRLRQHNVQALHLDSFQATIDYLEAHCQPGDLVVVMGAGPVWQVASRFLILGG
jgi:UDP-N-acetylmuramate--alanine ligase